MNIRISAILIVFALATAACGDPEPNEDPPANNNEQTQDAGDNLDAGGELDAADDPDDPDVGDDPDDPDAGDDSDVGDDDPDVGDDPDAGDDPDGGDDPDPTFEATWSWDLEINGAMNGTQRFDEDYAGSTLDVSCEIAEGGLRLQASVPSPVSGCEAEDDVLPLMIRNYDENGMVTQNAYPGPWSGLTLPVIHAFNGNNGTCFTRPLFEETYYANFTTDGEGVTTVDLTIEGRFDDNFGTTYLNFESTFVFDADACKPYDSGDPACGGGQTQCQVLPVGDLCTNSGCTEGNLCTYPTQEECAALTANECLNNKQCEYIGGNCLLGTGYSYYPDDCQHPQVTSQGQTFCEAQGCVWRDVCTGGEISCQDVDVDDDLICSQVPFCTW